MFDNRDNIDFGKADIPQLFRAIFIPTLVGMICNMAFIITDGIFVGHGVGPLGLASINLIAPIMMILNGIGMMFGIGASVVAAIHLAQNNMKAARINVTQAFVGSAIAGLLLGILFYSFPNPVMYLLGVSDSLFAETKVYLLWFLPTCLLIMIQSLGLFVIRLDGAPVYAMISNGVPALANIALDYIFIFPCNMGLKGAALATSLGQGTGVILVLTYMLTRCKSLRFYKLKTTVTSMRLTLRNIGYMTRVGLSGLLGELAMAVMMMAGNIAFGHYLGDDGVAAYSVICYLTPLIFMAYSAIAQSAQPIISYNHGAGRADRVKATLRHSLRVAALLGIAITLIFALMPNFIIGIFIEDSSGAYPLAVEGLPLFSAAFVFMAFNLCYIGYLQSLERVRAATTFTLIRSLVCMSLAFLLLPLWMGDLGLWLAVPAAEMLTLGAILLYAWLRNSHRNNLYHNTLNFIL